MPDQNPGESLLALLNKDAQWSVFTDLVSLTEPERSPILRPHDEAAFHRRHETDAMALRVRLDEALDALTLIEIGFETGLLSAETSEDPAWQRGGLAAFHTLALESEAFYGYATAYLYFGVRILAWRCYGPCWPARMPSSLRSSGAIDRRSFPIKEPPPLALPPDKAFRADYAPTPLVPLADEPPQTEADIVAAATQTHHAHTLFAKATHNLRKDARWEEALDFLDGFQPENYGHGEGSSPTHPEVASLYQEPQDYELWLRGLLPDAAVEVSDRFQRISQGLIAWAEQRTAFYLSMQSMRFKAANMTWAAPGEVDAKGTVLKNPLTARFALADIYWLARLLRAQVTSHASVRYGHNTWLSLLAFRADLDGRSLSDRKVIKDNERYLRLVFSFACDLAQNCAAIAELRENRYFNPWRYLDPGITNFEEKQVKEWRAVFDEELREIDQQRSIRSYTRPSFIKDEPFPWNSNNPDSYFSERLITGRQPYNRVGLAFSGGGIRSATFNLGVLQGLQELNMLRQVDYLSTVSGGGFIGGWLAGNVARTRQWLTKGIRWDESIHHLRSYASYLAPLTGIFSADTWTLGASWARNTFLIQLTGATGLIFVLLLPLLGRKVFRVMERSYPDKVFSLVYTGWPHPFGLHMSWVGLAALAFGLVTTITLARNFRKNRVETGENVPRSASILKWAVAPCWAGAFVVAALLCSVARDWQSLPPACLPVTQLVVTCNEVTCGEVAGLSKVPQVAYEFGFMLQWEWQRLGILLLAYWVALVYIGIFALRPAEREAGGRAAQLRSTGLVMLRALCIATLCSGVLYLSLCGVLCVDLAWVLPATRFVSHAFVFGPSLVLAVFSLSIVIFIGFSGRTSNEAQREWWTRFGAWLLIFALVGLAVSSAAVLSPILVYKAWMTTQHSLKLVRWAAVIGWLGSVLGGVLAGKSSKTAGDDWSGKLQVLARAGGLLFVAGAIIVTSTVLYQVLWSIAQGDNRVTDYWTSLDSIGYPTIVVVTAVVFACGYLFSTFFEINIFGLSQLYRNRLVRCYLGATRWAAGVRKPHPFTKFDFRDDMPLSDLRNQSRDGKTEEKVFRGPFPIFNCTLNLGGSSDLTLHSRHSASFSLTPLRCGCDRPRVGYAPTYDREAGKSFAGGVKLGQAIAISGAAASPNMGYNTSPFVALLLTMFNVRLGWWFPNPGRKSWAARGLSSSLRYLCFELLGRANETQNFLNVSDGGHFENLGVYELIRRRCKVIIASDAECDEALQFGGLGNLVRICATDFGAEIDLDVRSIAEQKNGYSLAHSAFGRIKYNNGSIGYLIYLKASMTGDEPIGITQYGSTHPSFPHETTANQFYSESQFESYRLLGQHVFEWAFRGVPSGEDPLSAAIKLEDVMVAARTSGAAYLKHTRALDRLWEQFRQTPSLHSFLDELMRVQPPLAVEPASGNPHRHTEELAMALQLMQLMEDVFMDLELDDFWEHPDNRGWALLFMRWARSLRFRNYWNQTHRTLGIRFEYFCAARLGLKRDMPIVRM